MTNSSLQGPYILSIELRAGAYEVKIDEDLQQIQSGQFPGWTVATNEQIDKTEAQLNNTKREDGTSLPKLWTIVLNHTDGRTERRVFEGPGSMLMGWIAGGQPMWMRSE